MRRPISRLLLSLAALLAGLALTAHVLSVVAFDPGRPGRVLAAMLKTDEGRSLAADAISTELQHLAPQVGPGRADAIGARVAGDPNLVAALEGAGDGANPMTAVLDAVADSNPTLAKQARRSLRFGGASAEDPLHPSIGSKLPSVPSVGDLLSGDTGDGISETVDGARSTVGKLVRYATLLALGLSATALAIGPRRDLLLRRIGRWFVGSAVVGALLWLVLPHLILPRLGGRWPVVIAAGLRASGAGLTLLFGCLLLVGVVVLVAGYAAAYLVPTLSRHDVPEAVRREAARRGRERAAWKKTLLNPHTDSPAGPTPSEGPTRGGQVAPSSTDTPGPRR